MRLEEAPKLTEQPDSTGVASTFYSNTKPKYRFDLRTLASDIRKAHFKFPMYAQMKANGMRVSAGLDSTGNPFISVNPENLKRKEANMISRMSRLAQALESTLKPNTILDCEMYAAKSDEEALHRGVINSLVNSNAPNNTLDRHVRLYAFDCLRMSGVDLRDKPFGERLRALHSLESTSLIRTTAEKHSCFRCENIDDINRAFRDVHNFRVKKLTEGLVLKQPDHFYETPRNSGWAKLKFETELDVVVIGRKLVKDQTSVYNYRVGIFIPGNYAKKMLQTKKGSAQLALMNKKPIMILGKTNNSKEYAKIGQIIRIAADEILVHHAQNIRYYKTYIARVIELVPEKRFGDSIELLEKLAVELPDRPGVAALSAATNQSEVSSS